MLWREAFGTVGSDGAPTTIETIFDLASLTKPIATATSVMLLVERGKLTPSDRVAKYWPDFAKNGKENVTVEHLLTHTSGLIADNPLRDYADGRDRPDLDVTSRMSVHLKWGEIHPRTMLADLAGDRRKAIGAFRKELAWREFYADVLFHRPETAREYLRPEFARMAYDDPGDRLDAWREGRTGYPIVDAGMRQLRATGWMHNRVRMIVASFLVKDLHIEWQHGARHFMRWLVDGDLASNQHGWQWVAGCGTDAAPYFRVFNPTTQGRKFDPDGDYVRRWVPELRRLENGHVHEPWTAPAGLDDGYPAPIVDHAEERREALDRLEKIRT